MQPDRVISQLPAMGAAFGLALAALPAQASEEAGVSPEILTLWAENALTLDAFVAAGYGDTTPKDASDTQWCAYRPLTMGLMYAKHASCAALIAKMSQIGRIE